jgi:aspartate/methionine/tyrosine aminotransferase
MKNLQVHVNEWDLAVFNGSQDALAKAMQMFVSPADDFWLKVLVIARPWPY